MLAFYLLASVYIVPICIIVEALSMFSTRECVRDICPLEYKKKYCPLGSISQYTPKGAGSVLDNMIFEDHFTQYAISASWKYQEIHPYSAVNIDSVKINTSLIMMKE